MVLLLGDGAAGFSLMDVDTLVRHRLPVVMICGNNGIWALEKYPMQALYGYDVVADLQPGCRYDEVVRALGGAGETVTRPGDIGPALRRAFDETMHDPDFVAEADRAKTDIEPLGGEESQKIADSIVNTPPAVVARAKALLGDLLK